MKRTLPVFFSACLVAALPAAGGAELACGAYAPLASPLRLEYGVTATRGPLSLLGEGAVSYQRNGDAYTMESSLQALGVFEAHQRSTGTVGPEGLIPRQFTQRSSRRAPLAVDFDWAAQRVVFGQTGASAPTRPQMQDRLSLLMQLAWRHRTDPRTLTHEVPVAGHRRTSQYVFTARGAEIVSLKAGRFETVKFERRKEGSDESLEVWLAPELCSLPVRLRFTDEKGTVIEQQLRAVRVLAP
jgi:hypothetical protein